MKLLKIKWIFLFFFSFIIQLCVASQSTTKPNATNLGLKKADIAYQDAKYSIAADYYNSYLLSNNAESSILSKLADCYWQMRNYEKALLTYKKLYPNGYSSATQAHKLRIAELCARNNEYNEAAKWLANVEGYKVKAAAYGDKQTIEKMKNDSLSWTLGFSAVNSNYRDFAPALINSTLLFNSNKPTSIKAKSFGWDGNNFEHLWQIPVSEAEKTQVDKTSTAVWKSNSVTKIKQLAGIYECGSNAPTSNSIRSQIKEENIEGKSNQTGKLVDGLQKIKFNVGAVSVDKNNHIYFSSNYKKPDKNGVNRVCLMEGLYTDNGVKNITKLPFGDEKSYSVMHPAVNAEGTVLVCSSDMPNGKGGYDLYYSTRSDNNQTWSDLKPLAQNINTIGNEVFPNITADGKLFFSSDATPGLGGLDIYKIALTEAIKGNGNVEHVSYPVNSSADDFGWTQDSTGTKGFFTSDRFSNNDNIYSFSYNLKKQIQKIFISGFVKERDSLSPLKGATVFLYNVTEDSVSIAKADIDGKYEFLVNPNCTIIIKAIEKSHIHDCLSAKIGNDSQQKDTIISVPRDLVLGKFAVGLVWKLNNIRYDFDKANIRPDATPILDSLVIFLKKYPVGVELGSHTDSRGSFAYNERLSQHRADSAVAYLIKKGIAPERIKAKGYGEYKLLNKCADGVKCSEAAHQANRRTEVKVTELPTVPNALDSIDPDKFKAGSVISKDLLPKGSFEDCK